MTPARPARLSRPLVLLGLVLVTGALAGCDVPRPPVEQLTPVVGSATRTPPRPAAGPPPTPAPLTRPPTGRLWFLREGRVWTCAPDGSGLRAASTSPATSPPVPAPDGRRIAFLSARRLMLLDATSGQETVLATDDMAPAQRPTWSPTGRLLSYFTEDSAQYGREIVWAVPADGGPPQRLTTLDLGGYRRGPSFERVARWAGDMRRVAVSDPMGPIRILPLDVTAGDPKTVNGGEPDWSTDNRTLLYTETLNGALALSDVVTDDFQPYRNERRRDGTRLGEFAQAPFPRFNADASLILYRAQGEDGSPTVAVRARADGAELLQVPGNNAAWAPDGQWIIYETGVLTPTATGPAWAPQALARVRADGSGLTAALPAGTWPAWAP